MTCVDHCNTNEIVYESDGIKSCAKCNGIADILSYDLLTCVEHCNFDEAAVEI